MDLSVVGRITGAAITFLKKPERFISFRASKLRFTGHLGSSLRRSVGLLKRFLGSGIMKFIFIAPF